LHHVASPLEAERPGVVARLDRIGHEKVAQWAAVHAPIRMLRRVTNLNRVGESDAEAHTAVTA
jgi:hypothetical protein